MDEPEVDTPEVIESEGEGAAEGRPEWLPSEFETPEALAKSYAESRRLIEQRGREANDAIARVEAMQEALSSQQQSTQQAQGATEFDRIASDYQDAIESGDYQRALGIQATLTNLQIQQAVAAQQASFPQPDMEIVAEQAEQRLRHKYGDDYDRLREKTAQVLEARPDLRQDTTTLAGAERAIDTAFKLALSDDLYARQHSDRQKAEQAEMSRQQKLDAQTLTGGGGRAAPADPQSDLWKSIAGADGGKFTTR